MQMLRESEGRRTQSTSKEVLLIFGEGLFFFVVVEEKEKRAYTEVGLMNVLMVAF